MVVVVVVVVEEVVVTEIATMTEMRTEGEDTGHGVAVQDVDHAAGVLTDVDAHPLAPEAAPDLIHVHIVTLIAITAPGTIITAAPQEAQEGHAHVVNLAPDLFPNNETAALPEVVAGVARSDYQQEVELMYIVAKNKHNTDELDLLHLYSKDIPCS